MGEFPARIVAEDFVTPPELASWRLANEGAGRIGGARVALTARGGTTEIAALYEQIPIRVFPVALGPAEPALVYLLNPTAGLMDGDAHRLEIQAGPRTHAVVTGQSATRIHPCLKGFCTQQWKVTVADGATLVILPGPAIPFAGCRYFQRIEVDLGKNAHFIWGDLWFAGRYARDEASERFRFGRMVQEMLVHRESRLVYRDRFCWDGPWDDAAARWHFGGADAVGTLFMTGSFAPEPLAVVERTRFAQFTTAAGDTCCRWTGTSEAVTRSLVETALRAACVLTGHGREDPWLLKGNHLARTHWFAS